MMRLKLFKVMRFLYRSMDKVLVPLFGNTFQENLAQYSQRVKHRIFPELSTEVSSPANAFPVLPVWALKEMHDLAQDIDPVLAPTSAFIASCLYYHFPIVPGPGRYYRELIEQCGNDHYTHCFAIPWLKTGGADLVALHHIQIVAERSDTRILIIMTEPSDSPWFERIPVGVDVLRISNLNGEISDEDVVRILARLLVQLKIDVLHIINSRYTWEAISKHGLAIKQRTRIYATVFCDDYDENGYHAGYARTFLPRCYKALDKVFTDNQRFPEELRIAYGFRSSLFSVIRSPMYLSSKQAIRQHNGKQILWAGRLDRQKRPDLLLSIAKAMPEVSFSVYGQPVMGKRDAILSKLVNQKNIKMLGSFDGVEALPFHQYSAFLYTSQWDGIPTIILAAAHAGIPIVASSVGGVGEVVTEEFGYPIKDIECISAYVESIREVLEHPELAEAKAKLGQSYVKSHHSPENFKATVAGIDGYLAPINNGKSLCAF